MEAWFFTLLTWMMVWGFWGTLFLRGPKNRMARIRCALRGKHFWVPTFTPIQKEFGVAINIKQECLHCHDTFVFDFSLTPEVPRMPIGRN